MNPINAEHEEHNRNAEHEEHNRNAEHENLIHGMQSMKVVVMECRA